MTDAISDTTIISNDTTTVESSMTGSPNTNPFDAYTVNTSGNNLRLHLLINITENNQEGSACEVY